MKKTILWLITLFYALLSSAQIGIDTDSPQALLHLKGSVSDFVVTHDGNVGIGTISPSAKLEVNSHQAGVSGMKITQLSATSYKEAYIAMGLGVNNGGDVLVVASMAEVGDIKYSVLSSDHLGWFLMNGRSVNLLPAVAKSSATLLGYTANLPNMDDCILKNSNGVETISSVVGNNYPVIKQANLPLFNIITNINGQTQTAGAHSHGSAYGAGFMMGGTVTVNNGRGCITGGLTNSWNGIGGARQTQPAGAHTHTVNIKSRATIAGQSLAIDNRQMYAAVNVYIYLGQ